VKGDPDYLRMTKFFGTLFLINFAVGVVTGIVQEFQFGMNWSAYSRFVGDVFGAPLAMEGLLAFFAESTFLGLWIFGWGRLPPRVHLAMIWLAALGSNLSAYFILAANSWMQHPVGYRINPVTHGQRLAPGPALRPGHRAVPPGHAARPGRHPGRRDRDRGHRGPAGPADGLPAADEDGRRGSPLQHLLVGLVLTVHGGHAERRQPAVGRPGA